VSLDEVDHSVELPVKSVRCAWPLLVAPASPPALKASQRALNSLPALRLSEAFSGVPTEIIEPHANRAVIFMFDSDNSVRIHDLLADCVRQPDDSFACGDASNQPIPGVRSLLFHDGDGRIDIPQGTLTSFGSMAAFPTVTFPNHNVVGSGVYPGHLGLVGNRYYVTNPVSGTAFFRLYY